MLLAVNGLSLAFGPKVIFDETGFQLLPGTRAGLVGPNGSGKTTLLRIVNGSAEADAVTIEKRADVSWGYLPQEGIVLGDRSVIEEVEAGASNVKRLQHTLQLAEAELQRLDPQSEDYAECLARIAHCDQRLQELEAHKLRAHAESILFGLGFTGKDLSRPCAEFSGGWQMRIALARLLLEEPDLLMMDEPTNHLDLDSLRWLEGFLRNFPGAVLLISHDRAFLDELCGSILSIESGRIIQYTGNFTEFIDQRIARQEQLEAALKSQQRKIAQTERFIERFRAQANKASQVQSRIKQLAKVERLQSEAGERSIHFSFPVSRRGGQHVLKVDNLHKCYDDKWVFRGFSMRLERGDRIGVVGINGAGKSTLARIISGREKFDTGTVEPGHQIDLGYFAQDQSGELNPEHSVLQAAAENVSETETRIRSILGAFLFTGDDASKRVKVLSGGEKNRLALARLLLKPSNFLVLDEPTNHLDMTSKAVLQQALLGYEGTTFIVSHDRDFLNPVVNKILEISPSGCRLMPGDLKDYLWKTDQERQATLTASSSKATDTSAGDNPRERRRQKARMLEQLAPMRKKLANFEKRISELESAIADRELKMADKAFFERGKDSADELREYDLWKEELPTLMDKWAALADQLESLDSQG